jgi:hypothetical protein
MWGVRVGEGGANLRKYVNMSPGDVVLFRAKGDYFLTGTVAHMMRNEPLATELWGVNAANETWELMYVLDNLRPIHLSDWELNQWAGFGSSFFPRGFMVMQADRSKRVIDALFTTEDVPDVVVTTEEFEAATAYFEGELDRETIRMARTEQSFIRQRLFGHAPNETCGICGEDYPVGLLVAAHIKRRAACADYERRDIPALVMPACIFGCDALFERGHVTVDEAGMVTAATELDGVTDALAAQLARLDGRECFYYHESNVGYFAWHRENVYKRRP